MAMMTSWTQRLNMARAWIAGAALVVAAIAWLVKR
jgi:hypothetical protein